MRCVIKKYIGQWSLLVDLKIVGVRPNYFDLTSHKKTTNWLYEYEKVVRGFDVTEYSDFIE